MGKSILGIVQCALVYILLAGCGESKEDIAAWVKQSLQDNIVKDDNYKGFVIGEVTLVRESSHKFTGLVDYIYGNDTEKTSLTVTVDGSNKMYQCEPPRSLIAKKTLQSLGSLLNNGE